VQIQVPFAGLSSLEAEIVCEQNLSVRRLLSQLTKAVSLMRWLVVAVFVGVA
jgi:hypothetical protein